MAEEMLAYCRKASLPSIEKVFGNSLSSSNDNACEWKNRNILPTFPLTKTTAETNNFQERLSEQNNWTYWNHNPHQQPNQANLSGKQHESFQNIESNIPYDFQGINDLDSSFEDIDQLYDIDVGDEGEHGITSTNPLCSNSTNHGKIDFSNFEINESMNILDDSKVVNPSSISDASQIPEDTKLGLVTDGFPKPVGGLDFSSNEGFANFNISQSSGTTYKPPVYNKETSTLSGHEPPHKPFVSSSCYYSMPVLHPESGYQSTLGLLSQKFLYKPIIKNRLNKESVSSAFQSATKSSPTSAEPLTDKITVKSEFAINRLSGASNTVVQYPPKCIDGTAYMNIPLAKGMTQVRTNNPLPVPATPSESTPDGMIPESARIQSVSCTPSQVSNMNTSLFNYFRPLAYMPTEQRMPISVRSGILKLNLIRLGRTFKEQIRNIETMYQVEARAIEAARTKSLQVDLGGMYHTGGQLILDCTQEQEVNGSYDKLHHNLLDKIENELKELEEPEKKDNILLNLEAVTQTIGGKKSKSKGCKRGAKSSSTTVTTLNKSTVCLGPYKRPRPAPLTSLGIRIMETWYERNKTNPYPSHETAEVISRAGGITVEQVKKWFANKRVRSGNTKSIKEIAKKRQRGALAAKLKNNQHKP